MTHNFPSNAANGVHMPSVLPVSVLDTAPVFTDQSPAQALRNTLDLARVDPLGYTRYWNPITADDIVLINLARTPAVTRYRYRGNTIPNPWTKIRTIKA